MELNTKIVLTFNIIHDENTLTVNNQEYIKDTNNEYVFVSVNSNITTIGELAFYNYNNNECYYLTKIVIPDSITTISNYAFYNCTSLTEIVIPDLVTTIGYYAFYNCESLTQIDIPDSVTRISRQPFPIHVFFINPRNNFHVLCC